MESDSVLVLAPLYKWYLKEMSVGLGIRPVVSLNVLEALKKLRHGQFAAVMIDYESVEIDTLELVLNVRDIDAQIPVIIIGRFEEIGNKQLLESQGNVHLVTTDKLRERLWPVLNAICHAQSKGQHLDLVLGVK